MTMKTMNITTERELKGAIIDAISDGRLENKEVSEFQNEIFNTDYFIVGRYEAEQWLINNGGIFNAIEAIKDYEQQNFGEVNTDLSEAEKVCNMYVYILSEEVLNTSDVIQKYWNKDATPEILSELLDEMSN